MQPETSYPAIIGRILEHERKEAGYDQAAFAEQMGLTQSAWSRIERGQSGLSIEHLLKISKVLNTKPHKIVESADYAAKQIERKGVVVHPHVLTNSDKVVAVLGLAALGVMILAILAKK
jgi:transcriptional regulator with XRE-family HTH domain